MKKGGVAKKGFTLIELIVVIAIIAVLAAVLAPAAFKQIEKAKVSATIGDYRTAKTGIMAFYTDVGSWPNDTCGLALVANANCGDNNVSAYPNWNGPYAERWSNASRWGINSDPTNLSFKYVNDANENWDGVGAKSARYLEINNIPVASARAIDVQIDGRNDSAAGFVHYTNGTDLADMKLLVSTDVVVAQ